MRKSFTLIELIFSMVIIAMAFTVLPKILQLSAKVSSQSLREEALYSGVALMGYIKATGWDENNTDYDDVLKAQNGYSMYDCNESTNYIRVGGFTGSRNCENDLYDSVIGLDSDDDGIYDDADDFNGSSIGASNYNHTREYNLTTKVFYARDINADLSEERFNISKEDKTNAKYVQIDINTTNKLNEKIGSKNIAKLKFWAFNIGQIVINRIPWYE